MDLHDSNSRTFATFGHSLKMQGVRELVRKIIGDANAYKWTLQGFGMLRLYMAHDLRLAVWDSHYRVPNVSLLHTHPWHFESLIVSGVMHNIRMVETGFGPRYYKSVIVAGEGGGLEGVPEVVQLTSTTPESYAQGNIYTQEADEIHGSYPEDGTITLCQRLARRDDPDRAWVFWEEANKWVSAEPRPATPQEVSAICGKALEVFDAKG